MLDRNTVIVLSVGILLQTVQISAYLLTSGSTYICQGAELYILPCGKVDQQSYMNVKSVTVITNSDSDLILNETLNGRGCARAEECRRTIHSPTDLGISADYLHLYNWIVSSCQGRIECNATGNLPEHWDLIDDSGLCEGTQYFASVLIDTECLAGEDLSTESPPPSTTPRTRPTTPTTTTPFPVFIPIYQPELVGMEKVILGTAIGLALAILLVLLIVLYCCERYRHNKRFGKLLRMLGAPQAQEDAFDELDYGRKEAWREETQNLDALGEYTGVKPDEFLTLDKSAMESSGQIMYDTPIGTMQKGNSCSTLDRLDRKRPTAGAKLINNYQGPTDYETEENLELERRMAAALHIEIEAEDEM